MDIWRPANFDSIELHRGWKVTQVYPPHWHDNLYIAAFVGGAGYLEYSGASYSTPRGTFAIVPAGEVHANRKDKCTFRCMFMDSKTLRTVVEHFMERTISEVSFRAGLIEDAQTMARFLRLHTVLETPGSKLRRDTLLSLFLHRLVARHSAASVPSSTVDGQELAAVQQARQFLDEHYADKVSLHDLARLTGLSPFHLHRSFCRKIGMPPHAYQVQVRISRARSFLRLGRSISDTASSTGFVDQSHFTHHFKRSVGVTPGRYLR